MPTPTLQSFLDHQIHTGTILSATLNEKAHKPAYILKIDFGPDLGIKTSSAQITENYQPADLINPGDGSFKDPNPTTFLNFEIFLANLKIDFI